jgi:tetratricopeptide (TPR) repeat protein
MRQEGEGSMVQTKDSGSLVGKISSYLQIVSKDPHSTAFVPLSEAFRQIGLLDDALEAARLGTSMLPHFSPGFATLGRILGQMGQIDEAMSAFARALSIDRQSLSALLGLARLHLVRGEREQARRILLQAAEFHPQDEMVENMLVALDLPRPWGRIAPLPLVEASPVVSAVESESGAEPAGKPIPTATLAEIYVKQGLTEQAIRVYEEIFRLDPGNLMTAGRLAELRGVPPTAADSPPAVVPAETAPPSPPRSQSPRQPVEILESWLLAIQVRRAHVH